MSKADAHASHNEERVELLSAGISFLVIGIFVVVGLCINHCTELKKSNISHTTPIATGHLGGGDGGGGPPGLKKMDPRNKCFFCGSFCTIIGIVMICMGATLDVHSYYKGC
jgi:hypothetical protein